MLAWQFNEPWPAICWSVLDFFRRPKPAYERLRQAFAPVLVSLDYPLRPYAAGDLFEADIWAINDLAEPLADCELRVFHLAKEVARRRLDYPADSCRRVGRLGLHLADPAEIRLEVWSPQGFVGANTYDLAYYDDRHISRLDAIRAWLVERSLR